MYGSGDGISGLAEVLDERMREAGRKDLAVDFGTVGKNGYLTTDSFQVPIGKGDYMACSHVGGLGEGDRVIVAWVSPVPVIIGKLNR